MNSKNEFGVISGIKHNFKPNHRGLYISYLVGRVLPTKIFFVYLITYQLDKLGFMGVLLLSIGFDVLFGLYDDTRNPKHKVDYREKSGQAVNGSLLFVENASVLIVVVILVQLFNIVFLDGYNPFGDYIESWFE